LTTIVRKPKGRKPRGGLKKKKEEHDREKGGEVSPVSAGREDRRKKNQCDFGEKIYERLFLKGLGRKDPES